MAGMIWAIENPNRSVVEPDEMDFQRILEICRPYLGPVVGDPSLQPPAPGQIGERVELHRSSFWLTAPSAGLPS